MSSSWSSQLRTNRTDLSRYQVQALSTTNNLGSVVSYILRQCYYNLSAQLRHNCSGIMLIWIDHAWLTKFLFCFAIMNLSRFLLKRTKSVLSCKIIVLRMWRCNMVVFLGHLKIILQLVMCLKPGKEMMKNNDRMLHCVEPFPIGKAWQMY